MAKKAQITNREATHAVRVTTGRNRHSQPVVFWDKVDLVSGNSNLVCMTTVGKARQLAKWILDNTEPEKKETPNLRKV